MTPRPSVRSVIHLTTYFSRVPASVIVVFALGLAGLAAQLWGTIWVGIGFGLLALIDGVMLAALPRYQRSFGPLQLPWLSLLALRTGLTLALSWLPQQWALIAHGFLQLAISLVATYACWIEPGRLGVTRVTVRSPQLDGCPPLRLLHLSDLHVERITARERRLVNATKVFAPDVIVITGDYLNISYTYDDVAQRDTRELLSQLTAPHGVYAILGSPSVDPPELIAQLLAGLDVTLLRDQVTSLGWHGCRLQIAGISCGDDLAADVHKTSKLLDGRAGGAFTVLLYHTPDVMPVAAEAGVDLFLAGHTHGGQLRLPFYGAVATASLYGKRYEMGAYRERNTLLYVTRGVGLEGKGAPRARFLCPPEIVLFTLTGSEGAIS